MIDDKELAELFRAESAEHLAHLDDGLLRLEKTPADQALLEELFRESHSLKGAAGMLGQSRVEVAAHDLETILNTARKGDTPLTPNAIERMTVVLGDLRKLVEQALSGLPAGATSAAPSEFPLGERRSLIEDAGQASVPKSPELASGTHAIGQSATGAIPDNPTPATGELFRIETVRVQTRKLDDLLSLVGELSVIEGRGQHRMLLMDNLLEQWAMLERSRRKYPVKMRGSGANDKTSEALRAEGELLAQLGGRLKEARDAFYEDGTRLETAVNTLQEQVHAARLLPLSTVFSLFPRMLRDLAKQQGKEVELVVEGGEISVDKRILEEMKDPLMHLLRNALDHGIELPADRQRLGKPRGVVRLRAVREGSGVLIEVRDDGRGVDVEAIRQVALKRGLHAEMTLATMTPEQLQQLIFLPGFSTSTFVSEISGRGVGLDVVRTNVEHLKGEIHIESSPQQGTLMQVRLPLSMATTCLLLAGVGDRLFGLPIEFIHTSLRICEENIFTVEGQPAIKLDGQVLIAPRLADLLALPAGGQADETVCIVIQVGDARLGLRVNELLGEEEVVTKPLGAPLKRVRNVSGLTILGSGEICAVLNPADLLRSARKLAAEPARNKPERVVSPIKLSILLVEDSALVRAMEKRILENAGYEVVAATDGVDALNALRRQSFAAVVSDITMPNMDGLTLTARIRQEPRYQDLPVILVTSLSSDDDKRRGLEVGASAYIPKPSFDQRVLLETLRRLM